MIRRAVQALVSAAVLASCGASGAAAEVRIPDDGQEPGSGISLLEGLVYFVGIPVVIVAVIVALVYLPGMRSPKTPYEPSTDVATRN